jgi:hypothetical protein
MFGNRIERTARRLALAGLLIAACLGAPVMPAMANMLQTQGLSFSDEKGGFRLVSVTGRGTLDDPITVTEDVTGPQSPVLVIRGFSSDFGNPAGSFHTAGFAMRKIIINHTDKTWRSYRIELREVETRTSNYEDGLSFGQNAAIADSYTQSPQFPDAKRVYEPEDSITYGGAAIPPGGTVMLQFVVTDMSPVHQFYLFQEPLEPISQLDMPAPLNKPVTKLARLLPAVAR